MNDRCLDLSPSTRQATATTPALRVAALRAEIRVAGRRLTRGWLLLVLALSVAIHLGFAALTHRRSPTWALPAFLLAVGFSAPCTPLFRRICARRFRRRLVLLLPAERERVLEPLQDDVCIEAQLLAQELLSSFRRRDLIPAPPITGGEPSPAQDQGPGR
jgi:hypothetical protein